MISGYGNGKFGPNDPITREQMAVILYNYAGSIDQNVGTVGDLSGFSDQEQVSGWARTQMAWAVGCGLINGKSGGALDPAGQSHPLGGRRHSGAFRGLRPDGLYRLGRRSELIPRRRRQNAITSPQSRMGLRPHPWLLELDPSQIWKRE